MEVGDKVRFLPIDELEEAMDEFCRYVNIDSENVIRDYKKAILPLADQEFIVERVVRGNYEEVILENCDCDHRRLIETYFQTIEDKITPIFGV